jgi:hypothetical protein
MIISDKEQKTLILNGFNSKEYKKDSFVAKEKHFLSFSDVFEPVKTVGIKKSLDGESDEDGFFQKSSFLLKDKATFTFFITLSEKISWSDAYVTLGADQSSFKLSLAPSQESFESITTNLFETKAIDRVVLHSETLVNEEVYENTLFVLGRRESYRQLNNRDGKKSKRYFLLQRGSVLYTQNLQKLQNTLTQPNLQKVGINIFTPIKGL